MHLGKIKCLSVHLFFDYSMGYSKLVASSVLVKLVICFKYLTAIIAKQLTAMFISLFVPFILCKLELSIFRGLKQCKISHESSGPQCASRWPLYTYNRNLWNTSIFLIWKGYGLSITYFFVNIFLLLLPPTILRWMLCTTLKKMSIYLHFIILSGKFFCCYTKYVLITENCCFIKKVNYKVEMRLKLYLYNQFIFLLTVLFKSICWISRRICLGSLC